MAEKEHLQNEIISLKLKLRDKEEMVKKSVDNQHQSAQELIKVQEEKQRMITELGGKLSNIEHKLVSCGDKVSRQVITEHVLYLIILTSRL